MPGKPRKITINGETASLAEWARRSGLSDRAIAYRLSVGILGEDLLSKSRPAPRREQWRRVAFVDRTGERYGRLTVTGFAGLRKCDRSRLWQCVCDCGNNRTATSRDLTRGDITSCGCATTRNRLPPGESSFNQLFSSYKRSAKSRRLQFSLARDQFRALTESPCFYCGVTPKQRGPAVRGTHGVYVYNGIDRIHNDYGYIISNVRPCCARCNVAKACMSEPEFFEWVAAVYVRIWEILEGRGSVGAKLKKKRRAPPGVTAQGRLDV